MLDPAILLAPDIGIDGLYPLYQRLVQPAAKANLTRAALLYREGGVYVDTDTITIAPFDAQRENGVFCGSERIIYPNRVLRAMTASQKLRCELLNRLREGCRRLPYGFRFFRLIEDRYYLAVNNAVLGAEFGHAFLRQLLENMVEMDPERQMVRFALGTHLLQQTVAAYGGDDFHVCAPELFYPLSPEVSEHWFRFAPGYRLEEVLRPETILVHWYASVRTKEIVPKIDADYIAAHADEQLFSALAAPFVD